MLEGYISEYLAAWLGHFVDISKEKLRVSLWSGARGQTVEGEAQAPTLRHRRNPAHPCSPTASQPGARG